MLAMGVLEAQPSSLSSHIHRMVKDEDNCLENKGSSFFFVFFLVAGLFRTRGLSLACTFTTSNHCDARMLCQIGGLCDSAEVVVAACPSALPCES